MAASGHDRLERAVAPLVEHLAFKFQLGGPREELPLAKLAPYAATALREVIAAEKLGREPVLVLDLHGLNAKSARQALVWDHAVTVVYFGKGEGVLQDIFHEVVDGDDDLVLIGTGGATDARPGDAMGLVLSAELAERLSARLDGEDGEDSEDFDEDGEDFDDEDDPPSAAEKSSRVKKKPAKAEKTTMRKRAPAAAAVVPTWRRAWPVLIILGTIVAVYFPPILVAYVIVAWLWFSYRD